MDSVVIVMCGIAIMQVCEDLNVANAWIAKAAANGDPRAYWVAVHPIERRTYDRVTTPS